MRFTEPVAAGRASSRNEPAGHDECVTGDEGSAPGAEPQDRICDLLGLAEPADRLHRDERRLGLWPAAKPAEEILWYGLFACALWIAAGAVVLWARRPTSGRASAAV